jgi:hypothetical protein
MSVENITFVVPVTRERQVVRTNFLASPGLRRSNGHQLLLQENFNSASAAYNDAIEKSCNDLMVFAHQDIILPEPWLLQLETAIEHLEIMDPRWGVLGCYGMSSAGTGHGHVYSSGRRVFGGPFERPVRVQTLDEIVLVLRKSAGLRFDEALPHFHLYGADICLRAAERGMDSYAISAFCIHNTHQILVLPKEFYTCARYIRRVWRQHLPVHTTCLRLTEFNLPLYARRFNELGLCIRRKKIGARRLANPQELLEQFRNPPQEFSQGAGLSFLTRVSSLIRGND